MRPPTAFVMLIIINRFMQILDYFDSFLPSTIREWNNLPADVKSSQTLTSFKYKFERNTPKIPKYYFFGDRGNQILHTR